MVTILLTHVCRVLRALVITITSPEFFTIPEVPQEQPPHILLSQEVPGLLGGLEFCRPSLF